MSRYSLLDVSFRAFDFSNEMCEKAEQLAVEVEENVDACRERSMFFTKMDEAMMWLNRAIAIQGAGDK